MGNFTSLLKKIGKKEQSDKSKNAAKERLHLVLMQDRANVSADFLEMMKQEIVDVIKKYIDVDENEMDVKLENRANGDGTSGAPALYANIPIMGINEEKKKESQEISKAKEVSKETSKENKEIKEKHTKKGVKKTVSAKKSTNKVEKEAKKVAAKASKKLSNEKKEAKVKKVAAKKKATEKKADAKKNAENKE